MNRWVLGSLLFLAGCLGPNGLGRVQARFRADACSSADPAQGKVFDFTANYLVTERFAKVLLIEIEKERAEVTETDGLSIRVDLANLQRRGILKINASHQLVPSDPSQPLVLQTTTSTADADVALSLFETCPIFPTSYATAGVLTFEVFSLAENAVDTGTNERLAGSLTSTISRVDEYQPVGSLRADFDFGPPARPLLNNE